MGRRKKLLFPLSREAIPCFSCELPMYMLDDLTGYCDDCHVMEEHKDYVSHLRVMSASWHGGTIRYLDHGAGSYPSPA